MYEELIKDLSRRGLSNGTTLGYHSGLMEDAVDALKDVTAQLTAKEAEIEGLTSRLETKETLLCLQETTMSMLGSNKDTVIHMLNRSKADLARVTEERDAANSELNSICGQIDEDEYLRKAFCVHGNSDSEICRSVGKNGYVDVDDCVGCELFCNSWRTPAKQGEEG